MTKVRRILILVVGAAGFEPATSCSQSRRATKLRYAPSVMRAIIPLCFNKYFFNSFNALRTVTELIFFPLVPTGQRLDPDLSDKRLDHNQIQHYREIFR